MIFSKKNGDLKDFLLHFDGIGFTYDPVKIFEHIFANVDIFKRIFRNEDDIACLHDYCPEKDYAARARGILQGLLRDEVPSIPSTVSSAPALFPSAASLFGRAEVKREDKGVARLPVAFSQLSSLDEDEAVSSHSSAASQSTSSQSSMGMSYASSEAVD